MATLRHRNPLAMSGAVRITFNLIGSEGHRAALAAAGATAALAQALPDA